MYKKILVTSTGEYLDEIMEPTLDLINERGIEVIGLYVADNSAPFLTPKKVKQMMVDELKERGKEILDSMEKNSQNLHIVRLNSDQCLLGEIQQSKLLKLLKMKTLMLSLWEQEKAK